MKTTEQQDNELRDSLYKAIYEEFVGPLDYEAEETLKLRPTERYSAGVLHPIGSEFAEFSDGDGGGEADTVAGEVSGDTGREADVPDSYGSSASQEDGDLDEPISLSNARRQSAISMTIAVRTSDEVRFIARAATYEKQGIADERKFVRRHATYTLSAEDVHVPRRPGLPRRYRLDGRGLELWVVFRRHIEDADVVTVALCNTLRNSDEPSDCYYQASVKVESRDGLVPPVWQGDAGEAPSEEEAGKRLIYRDIMNYAIGHGCATGWDEERPVRWAETRVMPMAETHPTGHNHPMMEGVSLGLESFGRPESWDETKASIAEMCARYSSWIDGIESRISGLPEEYIPAARRNVDLCRSCLERMRDGLGILEGDATARRAFHMANQAMFDQFLHYSVVSGERASVDEPLSYTRSWRPFQLAFILINIRPIVDETCDERNIVDLIWFPTGGGKTEAYLGLSAFTLIHERLCGRCSDGVTVIMRYTLRLLTSQQFDRASSLICALESMRRRMPDVLGSREFSIGLWVGRDTAPNTRKDAIAIWSEATKKDGRNAFPVRCCPWCGTEMESDRKKSYRRIRTKSRDKSVGFFCPNSLCEYSKGDGLPLKVVDEDIYEEPPSLVLGTVDKFATLPYRPEALSMFGITAKGERLNPPKLVIQDELHLISGPLGSMTAHYETMVTELCARDADGRRLLPKVVASTATVSRAKEQCNQLYACGEDNVFQFPPSGIDYDDSFFSIEQRDGRGRRYVGVFVPDLTAATTSIRLYADLMWTPATWEDVPDEWRDRYWTTIGYYGTTRELGQAVTWMGGDIPERLRERMTRARDEGKETKRYINVGRELTGRKSADEVKEGLDSLKISYPDRRAVDLCFATNMISVGLDVGRLGLMVVAGQPKSTAEYIQATSRVGRDAAKGIVFVVYSTTKPRDRSHYENFAMFHESFYQDVEPSSVTAFCRQVRDRALFGTIAGIYRSIPGGVEEFMEPNMQAFDHAVETVRQRVEAVDPEELDGFEEDIRDIEDKWSSGRYDRWQELKTENMDEPTPLMFQWGAEEPDYWSGDSFRVPTSMRSVDKECKLEIVGHYGEYGDEGKAQRNGR